MRRFIGALGLTAAVVTIVWAAAPPTGTFTREQIVWWNKSGREIAELAETGRFEEAERLARQRLALPERVVGRDHWQTRDARFAIEEWHRLTRVPRQQRKEIGRSYAINAQAARLKAGGRYADALTRYREALAIREPLLGEGHPETATNYNNVAGCLDLLGKASEALPLHRRALAAFEKALGEDHPDTATSCNGVGYSLLSLGKTSEALGVFRRALAIREKALGEGHPDTATGYNNVAYCLESLGKAQEALPLHRRALAGREKALGEGHPSTAASYNNVATCLLSLGKASEALPLLGRALAVTQKLRGETHPDTATGHNNVAYCLQSMGKASEALPLHRRALAIREKALGEDHPHTAQSRSNVAYCLHTLGKAAEALPLFRQALAAREKLGEAHPEAVQSRINVAYCLQSLGKASEALPLHRQALEAREKALGKDHPDTARCYNNVAGCLEALGKASQALPLYRRALAAFEKALGEDHPDTARGYNNVAACLESLGKVSEALPLHRRALSIRVKALGEAHPDTATSYNFVALSDWSAGEYPRAVRLWQRSLTTQEAARYHRVIDSGFDRALGQHKDFSVRAALAAGLARLGQPRNAFAHAEASLARGLLDDLPSPADPDVPRLGALRVRQKKLDDALVNFAGLREPTAAQRLAYDQVRREQRSVTDELLRLVAEDSARRVLPLSRIQKAIPAEAALLLWVDASERWGCVLRAEGKPLWTRLPGTGDGGSETKTDRHLPSRLHAALSDLGGPDRDRLAAAFLNQLFDPLRPHLKGVKRLFVVPSGPLAKVPLEALTQEYAVSYVPSGTVLALLTETHRPVDASSLLVLADPTFARSPPPEPPPSGVLVLSVVPGGHAARAGLQAGDVLLSVGKSPVDSIDDLQGTLSNLPASAKFWREGKEGSTRLGGSPLGAAFDRRSARAAVRAFRREREAAAPRGTGHKRLPGTRAEAEALAALFKSRTLLLDSDASEQKLDELIEKGELKKYRLLHFATHGETREQIPSQSALILAQDQLPDPLVQVNAGEHPYDGRLTVERIRQRWALDADLVVLSACETGLGKEARGDGLLGFAQAFLSQGARSVLLSRWKVDDTATALLMIRFYENLLGKRKDLKKPMGRAASLDETKKWLRTLPRQDAERLATLHTGGVLRGSVGDEKMPAKTKPVELKGDQPFAHPYYWAAFTLIGDPD